MDFGQRLFNSVQYDVCSYYSMIVERIHVMFMELFDWKLLLF